MRWRVRPKRPGEKRKSNRNAPGGARIDRFQGFSRTTVLSQRRGHDLGEELFAPPRRTASPQRRREFIESIILKCADDRVVNVALARDGRRVGKFGGRLPDRLQDLLVAVARPCLPPMPCQGPHPPPPTPGRAENPERNGGPGPPAQKSG